MTKRITRQVEAWIEAALEGKPDTDDIVWDVTLVGTPDGPSLYLVMFQPGPVLGSTLQAGILLANPAIVAEEDAEQIVSTCLEALAQERSKQLGLDSNAASLLLSPNGNPQG